MWFTWFKDKRSQKEKLLDILKDGCWHVHTELCGRVGLRYGGRIYDLRNEGNLIETRQIRKGLFTYRLLK